MRPLQVLFAFYIQASFHVALALVSLLVFTQQLFTVAVPPAYYGTLFFGSVAGYNAIKYGAEPWKYRKTRGGWNRAIVWASLAAALLAGLFLIQLAPGYWLLLGLSATVAALYALPVLPGFRNLRSFGLLKVLLVALVWTLLTLLIPLWESGYLWEWDLLVEGMQRLLWVWLLMLPFEVRDMRVDPEALRTLPRRLGLKKIRWLGWAGAFLFVAASLMKDSISEGELLVKAVAGLLTGLGVHFGREEQAAYYASFWIEAIPMAALACFMAWSILAG